MIKTGCHKVRGAYSIHIDEKRIRISAGDIEGVNNAVVTLLQGPLTTSAYFRLHLLGQFRFLWNPPYPPSPSADVICE